MNNEVPFLLHLCSTPSFPGLCIHSRNSSSDHSDCLKSLLCPSDVHWCHGDSVLNSIALNARHAFLCSITFVDVLLRGSPPKESELYMLSRNEWYGRMMRDIV